jgi:hypothetical protein
LGQCPTSLNSRTRNLPTKISTERTRRTMTLREKAFGLLTVEPYLTSSEISKRTGTDPACMSSTLHAELLRPGTRLRRQHPGQKPHHQRSLMGWEWYLQSPTVLRPLPPGLPTKSPS